MRMHNFEFRMKKCLSLLLLLVIAALAAKPLAAGAPAARVETPPAPPQAKESTARPEIEKLIQTSGGNVAVAFRSLDGSQELFIQPDAEFPASPMIIMIPVMIELYAEVNEGTLKMSDQILVHNGFHSIVDGHLFMLDPKDDSASQVYAAIGTTMSMRNLLNAMIQHGSKLAANLLIERLGTGRIQARIQALHMTGLQFFHGFEPGQTKERAQENMVSVRGMMELLFALAQDKAVSPAASQEMLAILGRAEAPQDIAAGLPAGVAGAHPVGFNASSEQAAIVYGPRPFVVVIRVQGISDHAAVSALTARITHALAAGIW
jgi:beta-lactamase class A